jgi:cytochrome c556
MGAVNTRFYLRATQFAAIDADAGVIRGVSVIAIGEARGHDVEIDATTLQQVKTCAETYANGLKVKMSHAGDAGDIIGYLSNFRIEGDKLFADLTLLKSSRFRDYVVELAETIPDTFGLSIAFSGPIETKEKTRLARCTEIYSADLVSEPAANPTGLFEAKPAPNSGDNPDQKLNNKTKTQMADTTTEEKPDAMSALAAAVTALSERLSKLESNFPTDDNKGEDAEMSAKLEQVAELSAEKALKLFAAKLGTAPTAPSSEAKRPADEGEKKFEEIVRSHPKYSENKALAIAETVATQPKAHAAYLDRCKSGEVIMF